jgi:RND family efflux transporter MFP subunit
MIDTQVQASLPETNLPSASTDSSLVSRFLVRHKTYIALLFVIASAIVFFMLFSQPKNEAATYKVASGPLKQYVKVSGQVKAITDANLSFQTSGAVAYVGVKTGDNVKQGKVLVTLSAGDAQASVLQAQANLASAQAVLAQLRQGARPEEIAYKQQVLENAKSTLNESYSALPDVIQNVDATTADIVKNKFSSLFTNSNGKYLLSFSSCDQLLQREIEVKRTDLESTLADFQTKSSVITAISSKDAIDSAFEQGYQAALLTNDLVGSISELLLLSCSLSNPNLDGYRATLSGAKSSMTALFSDITIKRSTLNTSKNAFKQATRDLELIQAGTDPYKIQAQRANVEQAQAQVTQAKSNLSKTILTAPFGGVISNVGVSIGETVSPAKVAISMLSIDGLEIEAKVPEIDIVKIKVGSPVEVTLDAYGTATVFPATVTRINPTATTEGTVPVYKVIVTFTGKDDRIKQGMSANVNVITEDKTNVLTLPARYIRVITPTQGEVTVLQGQTPVKKTITLGLRGSQGEFEIAHGLLEGDEVLPLP